MKVLPFLIFAVAATVRATAALATPPITLYYEERAPYQVADGGSVEGLIASPAAQAFKAAKVDFAWEASTMSRQLHLLQGNQGLVCAIGWVKNTERLAFAKFTKPVYRGGPIVALVRRDLAVGRGRTLDALLATPGLRVLIRGTYAYGPYIDGALQRAAPTTIASPLPNVQLVERLADKRADLMFASAEEATFLMRRLEGKADQLQVLPVSDPLPGAERRIACNLNVPDEIITRLNQAITFK